MVAGKVRRQRETVESLIGRLDGCRASLDHLMCMLSRSLGFPSGSVLVVRMFLHVHRAQTFGFVNERSLFRFGQQFPFGAEPFGDFRIVHFRIVEGDFPTLDPGPDHERVHGPFYMRLGRRLGLQLKREPITVTGHPTFTSDQPAETTITKLSK